MALCREAAMSAVNRALLESRTKKTSPKKTVTKELTSKCQTEAEDTGKAPDPRGPSSATEPEDHPEAHIDGAPTQVGQELEITPILCVWFIYSCIEKPARNRLHWDKLETHENVFCN